MNKNNNKKLGRIILIILLFSTRTIYAIPYVPRNFLTYKDTLVDVLTKDWDDITIPSAIPGQIEQETCPSLASKKCWNPQAELKTSREYGFGLGQITITNRFNTFNEVKQLNKEQLSKWKYEDRYNAQLQIIALVSMDLRAYNVFRNAIDDYERYAFMFAAYNGGIGGIQSDQNICRKTKGCNPNIWFGNVEYTSLKKKTVTSGYGKSFFEINREYPLNILTDRRFKYKPYIDQYFKNVVY